MPLTIETIHLPLPFRMGSVNCYLVETTSGFLLFDTGGLNQRRTLEGELDRAGCQPGDLKLIVLTHGDFDHSSNAAYLREKFGTRIAMHRDDAGMVAKGDMSWNRKKGKFYLKWLAGPLIGFGRAERFTPDIYLAEGDKLAEHGLDALVLSLPGHSLGSIGILLAGGELIGGDLLENTKGPRLNSIIDDPVAAKASLEKLKGYAVKTVYPGHGQPFPIEALLKKQDLV